MFDEQIKRLDMWDIGLIKWSVAAFVLFILSIWPAAMNWVAGVHWGWFLGVAIILAIRPLGRAWKSR